MTYSEHQLAALAFALGFLCAIGATQCLCDGHAPNQSAVAR